jgi:hypothetical protein
MSLLLRQATLCVSALLAVSYCGAQQSTAHTPSAETPASAILYSSSRTGLDDPAPRPEGSPAAGTITSQRPAYPARVPWIYQRFSVGAFITPLGIGLGGAMAITRSTDVRIAHNFFSYTLAGTSNDIAYTGKLHFGSMQANFDWFPWHGRFHISPGILFQNDNNVSGQGGVPGGDSFTVNGTTYYSSTQDPFQGTGKVTFKKTAPILTVGWGNWLPRMRGKHLSFPFEVGFAYTGQPKITLDLQGSVCESPQPDTCRPVNNYPSFQQNIDDRVRKAEDDLSIIRFYPVISGGVTYKF